MVIQVLSREKQLGGSISVLFRGTTWEAKTEGSLSASAEAMGIAGCITASGEESRTLQVTWNKGYVIEIRLTQYES